MRLGIFIRFVVIVAVFLVPLTLWAQAPTGVTLNPANLPENAPAGTGIGILTAQDPDPGDTHTFSLPLGWSYNALFVIEGGNKLKVKIPPVGQATTPDFESLGARPIEIRVRVVDSQGNSGEFPVSLTLVDDRTEDMDGDGLSEAEEEDHPNPLFRTSDLVWDSDGDGYGDGWEARYGGHPNNALVKPNRAVVGWGDDSKGQLRCPVGDIVAVAAGERHGLALRRDGAVVGWGSNLDVFGKQWCGQAIPPAGLTGVVAIAAGAYHSLALRFDGTVVGWGENTSGKATPPVGLEKVVAVAAGTNHSLALRRDGTVVGWGDSFYGQSTAPPSLDGVVAIAAGSNHSLALRSDGTVVGWGDNGSGKATPPSDLNDVLAIAAGYNHSLALRADGTVVGWGANPFGQATPPSGLQGVIAIAAGDQHSMGLCLDGTVVDWGFNQFGQRTQPTALDGVAAIAAGRYHSLALVSRSPVPRIDSSASITGTINEPLVGQRIVATGNSTSFSALGLPNGLSIDAVGNVTGIPTELGRYSVRVTASNGEGAGSRVIPVILSGGHTPSGVLLSAAALVENAPAGTLIGTLTAEDLDPGDTHAFSLPSWWSNNSFFEIEGGNRLKVRSPPSGSATTPDYETVGAALEIRVRVVDSQGNSGDFPVCLEFGDDRTEDADGDGLGEAEEEDVYRSSDLLWDTDGDSFGDGWEVCYGGDPHDVLVKPYRAVVGWPSSWANPIRCPAGDIVMISAGWGHSLGLRSDGTVVAWGLNRDEYGNWRGQATLPAGLNGVVAISAGVYHSLALRSDGSVVGWGDNRSGASTPPADLTSVVAIAAGGYHSLALCSNGTVVGWGDNYFGQASPPAGLDRIVAIAAGSYHSLALRSDGTVVAWGNNEDGQLTPPAGLNDVVAVAAGMYRSLALRSNGTVKGWGSEGYAGPPDGLADVVAIASGCSNMGPGSGHGLALRSDGTVVGWGGFYYGDATPPSGLNNVVAITAGYNHSLALVSRNPVPRINASAAIAGNINQALVGQRIVATGNPTSFSALGLPAGLSIDAEGNVTGVPVQAGRYSVRVTTSNANGIGFRVVPLTITGGTPPSGLTLAPGILVENAPEGTLIGTLAAQDADPGDTHTFSLPSWRSNSAFFEIEERNKLRVKAAQTGAASTPDFEAFSGGRVEIQVRVVDSLGNSGEFPVSLRLVDDRTEDTDGDGLSEAIEEDVFGSSDLMWDTDGDGYGDAWEVWFGGGAADSAVKPSRAVVGWGSSAEGQLHSPVGDVVAIAAGGYHSLALLSDGTVVAWGDNYFGQATPPPGLSGIVAIAAGAYHSLALRSDGTVVGWGSNTAGKAIPPADLKDVVAIAAGGIHSLALRRDGMVVGWGDDQDGEVTPSEDLDEVVAIAAGGFGHSLALRSNGTVVGWGNNFFGQATPPENFLDGVVAMAAGYGHSVALLANGTVESWGSLASPPSGLTGAVAIAAGISHSLALRSDGTVVGWGSDNSGKSTPPAGLNRVVAIAAGYDHSLALVAPGPVPAISSEARIAGTLYHTVNAALPIGGNPTHVAAMGLPAGLSIDPLTGTITGTPTEGGDFFVRITASNANGQSSRVVPFQIVVPFRYAPIFAETGTPNQFKIKRSSSNGEEIHYFRIVDIQGLTSLRLSAGGAEIQKGDFIAVSPSGEVALQFVPEGDATERFVTAESAFDDQIDFSGPANGTIDLNASGTPAFYFTHQRFVASEGEFVKISKNRGECVALVEVALSGRVTTSQRVRLEILEGSGTATYTEDYDGFRESLKANPLQLEQSFITSGRREVYIRLVPDDESEGDETFAVRMVDPVSGTVLNTAGVLILDDEQAIDDPNSAAPLVGLPADRSGAVSVNCSLGGTATGGRWRLVDEGRWRESGEQVQGLAPSVGDDPTTFYTVEFSPVPGYMTPEPVRLRVLSGQATPPLVAVYQAASPTPAQVDLVNLTVTFGGGGTSGGWRLAGRDAPGVYHTSGETCAGLVQGDYPLEFKWVSGLESPAGFMLHLGQAGAMTYNGGNYAPVTAGTTGPATVPASDVADALPYQLNGRLYSAAGEASGVVVSKNVVLTAAHAVFDETNFKFLDKVWWCQRPVAGSHMPRALQPQGLRIFGFGYAQSYERVRRDELARLSTTESFHLDAAALWFGTASTPARALPGGGGKSGYLVGNKGNPRMISANEPKFTLGFPVEGIDPVVRGSLHQSTQVSTALSPVLGVGGTDLQVYQMSGWRTYPGNSGGPLYVCKREDNGTLSPNFLPAGVVVGSDPLQGKTVVRAIDNSVAYLIKRAQELADSDGNITGQGEAMLAVAVAPVAASSLITVNFQPEAAAANATWRVRGTPEGWGWRDRYDNQMTTVANQSYTMDFGPVTDYRSPGAHTLDVGENGDGYNVTATYFAASLKIWARDHGIDLDSPPFNDRNGEAYKRLLKRFAFGATPSESEASARGKEPAVGTRVRESGQDYACFTYRRRKGGTPSEDATKTEYTADGITYHLDVTGNLGSGWSSGTAQLEGQPNPVDNGDGTETVTVKWKTPLPAQGARGFFRVIVSQ